MLHIPKFILYTTKDSSEIGKIYFFLLENWVPLFICTQLYFSLNNTKKKLYTNEPEMLTFNPKTRFQKYSVFCSRYDFFSANVSDFYRYFILLKIKNFEASYLCRTLSYTNTFQ